LHRYVDMKQAQSPKFNVHVFYQLVHTGILQTLSQQSAQKLSHGCFLTLPLFIAIIENLCISQ